MKTVGILALQGAVTEHIAKINQLNAQAIAIKHPSQLATIDGLILPGGESTVISHFIEKNHFYQPIRQFAHSGRAVFGTCAGLILCSKTIAASHHSDTMINPLALIDITIERNGFGRQIDSFETTLTISDIGTDIPAIFIRAPYIKSVGQQVTILASTNNHIVMAKQKNVLVTSFHPELSEDNRIIAYFLSMVKQEQRQ